MRLLFVTPEVTPFSGASPTGDTCAALPKALRGRGHEVTILSPLYGFIDPTAKNLARRLRKVEIDLDGSKTSFQVYDARTAAGVDMLFLGHEELFGSVKEVPTASTSLEDGRRFGAFCKAALEVLRTDDKGFSVIHCHGWQSALVPVLVDLAELEVGTVLTVHDVASQGLFDRVLLKQLGLPERLFGIDGLEFYGKVSFLKGGAKEADRVTTGSPTYVREITAEGGAGGLEGVFNERGNELVGITNGVDVSIWNPATDPKLESRYDPMDLSGKQRCKAALQRELGLPVRDDVALIGAIGSLHPDSGLDVLPRIVTRLMRNDVQLVVVPEGDVDESLLTVIEEHAKRWPDRLVVTGETVTASVHRLLSGADCVLVPPKQAPGGSLQQRAHRYGALPIAIAKDGIADTVVDCDAKLETGNGFLFTEITDGEVLAAMQRAIAAYAMRPAFEKVRSRALRTDHGWDRSAYLYEHLYSSL